MIRSIAITLFLANLLASCGRESTTLAIPPTVRDSAGVSIVENITPAHSPDEFIRVSEGSITIGGASADATEELYRVAGAIRLDNGHIVIANGGTAEIRFYDSSGVLLRSVGAQGGGPGEFQGLSSLARYGRDSLVAFDGQQRRLTFYDLEGNLGRMTTIIPQAGGGLPFLGATLGVFADGTFFIATIDPFSAGPQQGVSRGSEPTFHVSASGTFLDSIGNFPGRELYIAADQNGVRATARIFGHASFYTTTSEHVFVGTNDRFEITRYSPTGSLQMIIRAQREPIPVEGHHRDMFMQARVADLSPQNRVQYEARYDGNEPPATFPAFGAIVADRDGNLWVSHYLPPDQEDQRFSVFTPDGHWAADVDVPDDITVLEIGSDYLLTLWRDELDVEHVQLMPLERL